MELANYITAVIFITIGILGVITVGIKLWVDYKYSPH